jgi:hypothetical protein
MYRYTFSVDGEFIQKYNKLFYILIILILHIGPICRWFKNSLIVQDNYVMFLSLKTCIFLTDNVPSLF